MYTQGFVHVIVGGATGQPYWLASSVRWSAHVLGSSLTLVNTLSASTQVIIGLGLLCRPTVKGALALSFAWSFFLWWFAEGFGFLFSNTARPLTGAPGAVPLYAIIGLLVWPNERPGGLLGAARREDDLGDPLARHGVAWLLAPN